MKIYVVMVYTEKGLAKVSQEAYTTLTKAQEFCIDRGRAIQINDFLFTTPDYWYIISEVTVSNGD